MQVILWNGIPIYWRLLSPGTEGAGSGDFALATIAVIVMQAAHWAAFRLRPHLRFRRNVLLGHVLLFIGELSLFFINALAVVILFDRSGRSSNSSFGKSSCSWRSSSRIRTDKYQLSELGGSIIEGEPEGAVDTGIRTNSFVP